MTVALDLLRHVEANAGAPPDRRAVRDWALRRLYEGIFSGEFGPGAPLSEADLAKHLGVSRQPVRDAMRQLEADGLIAEAAGNGARAVVAFERHHIIELYTLRAALEAVSFRAACSRITDEQLAALAEVQEQLEARLSLGEPAPGEYDAAPDFRFHEIVAESAGMPQLHSFLVSIWLKTWALLNQVQLAGSYPNQSEIADSYSNRRLLLNTLRTRDGDRAASTVEAHVTARMNQLLAALDSGRGSFRFQPAVPS
ncbi:GntR family transcriptional regulator [Streptomyces hainanensis]|uniref:GntR family transcriptional regulator n=1 Tax=Streptomyces hainanensis TaxID=402648 RepID=A0A4R4TWQ9_9ACTN|nr:GntR family transcriptional regulator [Streptomyces hainanensis]TDC80494.1 GntR family transcriptional regulator [Streptomyces hainanensis]